MSLSLMRQARRKRGWKKVTKKSLTITKFPYIMNRTNYACHTFVITATSVIIMKVIHMNNQFPQDLLVLSQWVCYKSELDQSGRLCKVPYNPHNGKRASVTAPTQWGTYQDAVNACNNHNLSGIGFVFTAKCGIVGIDIDNCIDEQGNLNTIATEILNKIPTTYVEYSPSKRGLHIFLKGTLTGKGNRNSNTGVEIYSNARYFTMTGNRFRSCADIIADDNSAIEYIQQTFISPPQQSQPKPTAKSKTNTTVPIPDEQLINKGKNSADGDSFTALWNGNWQSGSYKSQSEADFALCRKLAFWTAKDESQIDSLFRQSGLMRPKWDEIHGNAPYGATTIRNACNATKKVYTAKKSESSDTTPDIFEQGGAYYRNKNQKTYKLTNFVIIPIEMIIADDETQLNCELVTMKGRRYTQIFMSTDFASLSKLKMVLTKKSISFSFFGGENDLEVFKQFIDNLEWTEKRGVKCLGIHRHNGKLVFADTNGAIGVGGVPVNDLVQIDKHKDIKSDILTAPFIDKTGLLLLAKHILGYNDYSRTVPILAWSGGCMVKPHLRRIDIKFPHLCNVGEQGGGKSTSLEWVILPMFGKKKSTASFQTKPFALMKESNSSNVIPQSIEEFKPSKLPKSVTDAIRNHLRDSYDWHEGVRGKADQTVNRYDLIAPIVLCGEEDANEGAIRERTIELLFSKRDIVDDNEHRAALEWIKANQKLVRAFGRSLLDMALQTTPEEVADWYSEGATHFRKNFPDRVINNLCAIYAGLCLINKLCQSLGIAFNNTFPLTNEQCAAHLETSVRKYLLDDSNYNKGAIEQGFEVMARMKLKQNDDYAFENNGQFLCLHLAGVYDRFTGYCKNNAVMIEIISHNLFRKQLEHSDFYVEKNRLKKMGEVPKRVWVLDFHKLSAVCDVSGFVKETSTIENKEQ